MLKLDDVSVRYADGFQALQPVSLTFASGDLTILLGPSGAGKSTLLRCLNRLVTPATGRISTLALDDIGANAHALRQHRRRTGMIFQHHQLIQRRTALQNVLTGRLSFHSSWRTLFPLPKEDLHLALACLERVGLLAHAMTRVDRLSGGQQQRVGIARALVSNPGILLADEPVASLDPASALGVMSLIQDICKEDGLTTIVSLHQIELAQQFADRIVGLRAGAVTFDGTPQALSSAHIAALYAQDTFRDRAAATPQAAPPPAATGARADKPRFNPALFPPSKALSRHE
jgi:phosphonate transport system ATP-binding protein